MDFADRVHDAVDILFDRHREEEPPPGNVRSLSRRLNSDDVDSFMEAADRRESPLWEEMDGFLRELATRWPMRSGRLRKELRWLRKQAYKQNLHWGKK